MGETVFCALEHHTSLRPSGIAMSLLQESWINASGSFALWGWLARSLQPPVHCAPNNVMCHVGPVLAETGGLGTLRQPGDGVEL